jgi:hypothetical protein
MLRTAVALLTISALAACGDESTADAESGEEGESTAGGETPEAPAPNVYLVTIEGGSILLPPAAGDDAKVTLVSSAGACVGRVMGGGDRVLVAGCPLEPRPWIAIGADAPARVTLAERTEAPSLEAGAAYVGRFGEGGFGFRLESPAGDGLCPGAPTTITFLHGDGESFEDARVLGQTIVDAPVTRSGSEGVMALIRADGQVAALVLWGGDQRRVVTLEGTILFEGQTDTPAPCDCCEG